MSNPYCTTIQDSPEYKRLITGRTDDIARLLDYITLKRSIALFGERKIGKTSLLFLLSSTVVDDPVSAAFLPRG
jgi:predicted AAA+ superfamily ATPase